MTIIDHINANNFLNNDMHSGIITAGISDHFPIFLISKDWKHVVNEKFPNNVYNEFLRMLLGLYNEAFSK